MISATDALQRLREGNQRFIAGETAGGQGAGRAWRHDALPQRGPFAIVLACSDSRAPPELVFDQGPGELFVVRAAGQVVVPVLIGSIDFALLNCTAQLIVVMGHSDCGAVQAALDECERPGDGLTPDLRGIVDLIRPAVEPLLQSGRETEREALVPAAVRANIRASANHLRSGSGIIGQRADAGSLAIVCAEYSLETGVVDCFDGVPGAG